MKFDKVIPKKAWPKQKVYQRISQTDKDIANLNRLMNKIDGQISLANHTKEAIKRRVANKWRYLRQLKTQLKEELV